MNKHDVFPHVVPTPIGDELILDNVCDEPTRVINTEQLRFLLRQADPHRHETIEFHVVK